MRTAALLALLMLWTAARAFEHYRAEDAPSDTPCEGIWQMAGDGAVFVVTADRVHTGILQMEVLLSPDFTVAPHTSFGTLRPGAKPGCYTAELRLRKGFMMRKLRPGHTTRAAVTFTGGTAAFEPFKAEWSVDLLRLLPYLWRSPLRRNETNNADRMAAQRIAPEPVGAITIL